MSAYRSGRLLRLVTGALALVTTAGLAGCTSSSNGPSHHPTSVADTARTHGPDTTATPPPTFSGTRHALPSGAALKNEPGLYKTVRLTGCRATRRGWTGVGTARNTTRRVIDYRIVVVFTDPQARAVDSATTAVSAPASRTVTWTARRKFRAPQGTRCVVRAVRSA